MNIPAQPQRKPSDSGSRPRRQPRHQQQYRRTSAIVSDRPDGKPVLFGYGRHLTNREKERVKHRIAYGALAAVIVASVVIIAVAAIYSNVVYPNQAVAWVNGHGISRHDRSVMTSYYTAAEAAMQQQGQSAQSLGDPQTLGVAQLQKSLLSRLSAQQQFGIAVSTAETQRQLNSEIKGNAAAFNQRLSLYGISKDDYLRLITAPQVLETKVGQRLTAGDPKVADQWHYARIQVATEKAANSVLQQLLRGASFSALAKKQSADAQSAPNGGAMGWERVSDAGSIDPLLVSTFLKPLQNMQKTGTKYQVVKYSNSAWWVIEYLGHDPKHPVSATQQQQDQVAAFNNWFKPIQDKANFNPALPPDQTGLTGGSSVTSGQTSPSSGQQAPASSGSGTTK